ncbi:REP-associated tyrosine transposase [Shimia abyssi]|uniref:REP-associated tyrosine transposase n=1 Tax=Shimia abyssi TaxID=1662395 RepID=UPI000D0CDE97
MPNYRRDRTAGGTWYFTVCLRDQTSDLLTRNVDLLRECVAGTMINQPFAAPAWVVLPSRMHCIWTLPPGDMDFSNRWKAIKGRFSRRLPDRPVFARVARRPREKGVWQNRFWEHRIRGASDFQAHLWIVHQSPVQAGLVRRAEDWVYSSAHRTRRVGRTNLSDLRYQRM